MARKLSKKTITDAIMDLNPTEVAQIVNAYNRTKKTKVKVEPILIDEMHEKLLKELSPITCVKCGGKVVKDGKTIDTHLQKFKCKECGKKFNILSETILDKSPIPWNIWVLVLQDMLNYTSIKDIHYGLIMNHHISNIDESTVSIMTKKLREMFIYLPLPTLTGVIQIDEKHFRESQKGKENPDDVLNKGQTRTGHERATKSQYGTMGPEFSTTCCMVDDSGHSVAKVITMGRMTLEMFEDDIVQHIKNPTFICTDMNPIYGQWCALNNINQYCIHSEYHKNIQKCDTQDKLNYAYEQNKLDYIVGMGVMSYKKMCKIKRQFNLNINKVNSYHSELERLINNIAKGVSTKHLQSWVSFYNHINNWRVDHGRKPSTYADSEAILIEMVKMRKNINIDDIKNKKDLTRKVPTRYTKKLIMWTVNARNKSNNKWVKLDDNDPVAKFNKTYYVNEAPEYRRRQLAKILGIKPFSPTAISSKDLKKKLLAHPNLEDGIYKQLGSKNVDI